MALLCSAIAGVHGDIKHNSVWSKVKTSFESFVLDIRIRYYYKTMILIYVKDVLVTCNLHIPTDFLDIIHSLTIFWSGLRREALHHGRRTRIVLALFDC